ncbi:lipoprotein LpqH [uncultured Mycobacterium sp.]|uniref:lipoprotein LpqH n=1 Tax=uncultured Mycobacterium sp. TaxID=171292 RepID=UPI0035CB9886
MNGRWVAVLGGAALVAVIVSGCSGASKTNQGAPGSGAASIVKVVVDGKPRHVENHVECVTAANMVFANVGSDQDRIAATLSEGDNPRLISLVLGAVDEVPLMYNDSNGDPRPTVTKTGSTYTIVGTATGPSPAGGGNMSEPFDLEFTCPPRS